ncbi:MAG TPA: triose-phosphate isomerase [Deltaproteobacteria bacterium]|nr:triose-phosphate isomerase [SAR324 cluster bacterium]HIF67740.1 triose-phosphate isomerase [Candidatus Lambdaproteobacteria bacterium]HIL17417.1 triose-phosphate isomerase [Deltaproteobacteria bacterium]
MRKKLIAGNWKMHGSAVLASELFAALRPELERTSCEIALCPPFPLIPVVCETVQGSRILVGAQNVHTQTSGAFTGEVPATILQASGVQVCIVGHSERRSLFAETDEFIRQKIGILLQHAIRPVLCVGEVLEEREQDVHEAVVIRQLRQGLAELNPDDLGRCVVAYEPVWAIGTGRTATPEQANAMHQVIRQEAANLASAEIAANLQILYGGSVNAGNAETLLGQSDIDGALVGGASLKPEDFRRIVLAGG